MKQGLVHQFYEKVTICYLDGEGRLMYGVWRYRVEKRTSDFLARLRWHSKKEECPEELATLLCYLINEVNAGRVDPLSAESLASRGLTETFKIKK
jgi:hypothetical protein